MAPLVAARLRRVAAAVFAAWRPGTARLGPASPIAAHRVLVTAPIIGCIQRAHSGFRAFADASTALHIVFCAVVNAVVNPADVAPLTFAGVTTAVLARLEVVRTLAGGEEGAAAHLGRLARLALPVDALLTLAVVTTFRRMISGAPTAGEAEWTLA
jgi:hypothetical protein